MEVSGKVDKYCMPCEAENEKSKALGICKQCGEYMCQRCFKHHRKARSCRDHDFLETNKTLTSSVQLATDDVEKCSQHGNETIKFYCWTHCVVGCGTCMLMGGHKTCDHGYINDLGKDYQKSKDFKSLMTRIVNLDSKTSENVGLIQRSMECNIELKEQAVSDIKTFTADLRVLLNAAEVNLLSDVDKLHAKNEAQMKALELKCKSVQTDTDKVKQNLDTDRYQGNALFINAVNSSEALVTLGQALDGISSNNSLQKFLFQQNKDLLERMKFKNSYGALLISSNDEKRSGLKRSGDEYPAACENRGLNFY